MRKHARAPAFARATIAGSFVAQAEAATWDWVDSCVIGMGKVSRRMMCGDCVCVSPPSRTPPPAPYDPSTRRGGGERVPLASQTPSPDSLCATGLCPFAAPVRAKSGPALRCAVSNSSSVPQLLCDVRTELALLAPGITSKSAAEAPESTLLVIAPEGNHSFLADYRDFVS